MELDIPQGATPLDPNEIEGLIPSHIQTRAQLDRWEQENINEAMLWAGQKKRKQIFSESFIRRLHKKMFGRVWKWAGQFRQRDKNIGISWYLISTQIKLLCEDTEYWIANKTFSADEIAARFHHRLVSIHPFPNGNGRHARFMTDLLMENILHGPALTWGGGNLIQSGEDRKRYIESLQSADHGNYDPLIRFIRS